MSALNLPQVLIISRGLIFHKGKYLFIKRHHNDNYAADNWELPGGKLDTGENIEENLFRECSEEVGIQTELLKIDLAVVNDISQSGKYKGVLVVTIFGLLKASYQNANISDEHSEYKWLTLAEADLLDLTLSTRMFLDKVKSENYLSELLSKFSDLSFPNK